MDSINLPDSLLLKNARLLDPELKIDKTGNLLIEKGMISAVDSG